MAPLGCRADNPECLLRSGRSVLQLEATSLLRCDVCCAEPGFCPQCKCILCSRAISPRTDEWIQCLQRVSASNAGCCGHCVHLHCAVQCRLAGVVDDTGLDVEYLCRRCDRTTDLLPRVSLLVQAVAAAPTKQLAEGNARLAASLVTNTRRAGLKKLETLVRTILVKADSGEDIQAVLTRMCKNDSCNGNTNHDGASGTEVAALVTADRLQLVEAMEGDKDKVPAPVAQHESLSAQSRALVLLPQPTADSHLVPLESVLRQYRLEVDRALADLKRAQEQEYATARGALVEQMKHIMRQYQLLESDRWLLASSPQETYDAFMERTLQQLSNLKKDRDEFESMLRIRQGFGSVPKELLRNSFNWPG